MTEPKIELDAPEPKKVLVDEPTSYWRSLVVQAAALAVVLPEILEWLSTNLDLFPFPPAWKDKIRLVVLVAMPLLRIIRQPKLAKAVASSSDPLERNLS